MSIIKFVLRISVSNLYKSAQFSFLPFLKNTFFLLPLSLLLCFCFRCSHNPLPFHHLTFSSLLKDCITVFQANPQGMMLFKKHSSRWHYFPQDSPGETGSLWHGWVHYLLGKNPTGWPGLESGGERCCIQLMACHKWNSSGICVV